MEAPPLSPSSMSCHTPLEWRIIIYIYIFFTNNNDAVITKPLCRVGRDGENYCLLFYPSSRVAPLNANV